MFCTCHAHDVHEHSLPYKSAQWKTPKTDGSVMGKSNSTATANPGPANSFNATGHAATDEVEKCTSPKCQPKLREEAVARRKMMQCPTLQKHPIKALSKRRRDPMAAASLINARSADGRHKLSGPGEK